MDGARAGAKPMTAPMYGYVLASLVLIGLQPFLPVGWRRVSAVAVCVGVVACTAYGRRATVPDRRAPATLVMWAFAAFAASHLVRFLPGQDTAALGGYISGAGYVLVFAAGLAFVVWRGAGDVGGILDSVVIALAAGSVLWVALQRRISADEDMGQVEFFVALFALAGLFGAMLRLATTGGEREEALWWLLVAAGLGLGGKVCSALAGNSPAGHTSAVIVLLVAATAIGMFGLDPNGPRLVHPKATLTERLSPGRLAFLGLAVAFIPLARGTRELLAGDVTAGLVLFVPGVIAVLVMARIGLLSAQRTRAEEGLQYQATHDPLTQLPYRRQFTDRLRDELDRRERCVVLFCDLDGFKAVNDRLGHDAGDALLVEVASRLVSCVGPADVVSRVGGDEFVVLLIDPAPKQEEVVRNHMLEAVRRPIGEAGGATIDISIGVATADGVRDPEQLIRSADQAMYRVKAAHASGRPASHSNPS